MKNFISLYSGTFSLTVRDWDEGKGDHVKHYKIRKLDNDAGFYIAQRSPFTQLSELVAHYQGKAKKENW